MRGLRALWLQARPASHLNNLNSLNRLVLIGLSEPHHWSESWVTAEEAQSQPQGWWSVRSHCSQVKKENSEGKTSSFPCEPRSVFAADLLAVARSDTPPPPVRGRGQPAASGRLRGRTRQLAPAAMFIHPWDTPAVNFPLCDSADKREESDPHVALAEITALSARAENTS